MSEKWNRQWLDLADAIGSWSKDPSTKVGCIIVGDANQILAQGYNGFPRGINDDPAKYADRELKYRMIEHAERNAIYNAARTGTSLVGSTVYVPYFPCIDCARGIIQSGVVEVVTPSPSQQPDLLTRWRANFVMSCDMLTQAGVRITYVERNLGERPKQDYREPR